MNRFQQPTMNFVLLIAIVLFYALEVVCMCLVCPDTFYESQACTNTQDRECTPCGNSTYPSTHVLLNICTTLQPYFTCAITAKSLGFASISQRTTRMESWSPYILLYILANNVQSVSAQLDCPAGSFVNGSAICQSCLLGKYTTSTNTLTTCTDCVPSQYSNTTGATRCSACPQDRYSNTGYGFIEMPLFDTRTYQQLDGFRITGFATMTGTDNIFFCATVGTTFTIYKNDMKTFVTTNL